MLKKVAFTMYPVEDLNRARQFYEKKLGLTVGSITANGRWVEYDLPDGGCFTITDLAEGLKPSANAGGSIAFEVEDLDKLVSHLKEENVKFKLDIFSSPVCRMAVIIDSEGNAITLHQLNNPR
ncbi:Glyoxalase/bleomycin resistance protein/dioxygenase [Legionella lansingensis]|uniref:Glyoxalase/bleomycin resistance protein/dioxygenase n=1 Tax=Legionella lansingensis TaxID=45067 RepID=A0A0W0VPV3_9GAMM|nr:VOC family protein [Legionella lansingensis]KTD22178.1 Glyoxalase/bleomycin resistance protein/dioxygenase [Legionella lansingensis]SNV54735.1 Glyoxalase/bleomycin resistance protein/dioxygenase [Legionella lansingensis]